MATENQVSPSAEPRINQYFRAVVKMEASDLHLKANCPPHVRLHGDVLTIGTAALSRTDVEDLVMEILSPEQREDFQRNGSVDLAHELSGSDRFRINVFRQRGLVSLAARRVSKNIPTFEELHLPPIVPQLSELRQGLILVTGITGSGKSTTIAAMIEHINQTRPCHIVTLEDPIEYLYEDKKAFVNQREIGIDVPDFAAGLKYLMREDPDVVLIGEMRDTDTFEAALHAAETGHLVLGTVHAGNTISTINRVLDLFPEDSRELVRQSLVFNLRAIIGLRLMPSIAPEVSRIPAVEVLIVNAAARKMILEKREQELIDVIHSDRQSGMLDFNASLEDLVDREMISLAEALANSPNPNELRMRLKGIRPGG
ncbi:MAG: PilT/PilU family type 4a pilus ATPase [Phycisphaerae bacterium]|nr:PilT/PilU family type 4a pilus ATPase [Phycisphaerae bacterium]